MSWQTVLRDGDLRFNFVGCWRDRSLPVVAVTFNARIGRLIALATEKFFGGCIGQ